MSYTVITAEQMEAKRQSDAAHFVGVPAPRLAPAVLTVEPNRDYVEGSTERWQKHPTYLLVSASWLPQDGLDRLDLGGWSVGPDTPANRRLAGRLIAAINAGVVITPSDPFIDTAGARGWHANRHILGRTLNADLRRLGF